MSDKILEAKAELVELLHQKAILEARSNFYKFVKLLAGLMLNGDSYRDGAHIEALALTLQDVDEGSCMRLMVSLPPGSMKSVLLMMFSAWCLGRHPTWRVMWISHTADKAQECSGQVRDLLRSDEYQEVFPNIHIREDQSGVTHWKLTTGGSFRPAGAGAAIAGYRFNLGIIDDPLSEQSAHSETDREKINRWYPKGFRSRKLPDSRIVIVATRWHTRDLIGFLLDHAARATRGDQWEVVSIPAILDEASAEYLGLEAGGSYWPEFITLDDLSTTQADMPKADWAALYLQNPVGEDGNIFTKSDFKDWEKEDPPFCEEIIQVYDTAFSERQSADYSVIQTWGIFYTKDKSKAAEDEYDIMVPNAILLNMVKGRWSYPELRKRAREQYKTWEPDRIIVENKASGQSLIQDLKLNKLPVLPFQPDRDKVARAHAVTGIVERGRVWLPLRRPYANDLLKEALEFPRGAHDDAVDAMVMALLYLRRRYELTQESVAKPEQRRRNNISYWKGVTRHAA